MNTTSVRFLVAAVMGFAAGVCGQVDKSVALPANLPVLKAGMQIRAANKPLCVGHTACPEVLDWNHDGKKDLLVGTFEEGKVMLFLNQGTDAAPRFDQGRALQAGGKKIGVGFG